MRGLQVSRASGEESGRALKRRSEGGGGRLRGRCGRLREVKRSGGLQVVDH